MAMKVEVDLIGLAEAQAKIGRLALMGSQAVKDAVNESALNIQREARKKLTASKAVDTGRLRASIRPTFHQGGIAADIGTDVQHAPFIEYGTGPSGNPAGKSYFPPAGALLDWMKRHGIPPEAEMAIRRKLFFKGTPARPFLFPSFEEEKPKYVANLRTALKTLERIR